MHALSAPFIVWVHPTPRMSRKLWLPILAIKREWISSASPPASFIAWVRFTKRMNVIFWVIARSPTNSVIPGGPLNRGQLLYHTFQFKDELFEHLYNVFRLSGSIGQPIASSKFLQKRCPIGAVELMYRNP